MQKATLGLIAGNGILPLLAAEEAKSQGLKVVTVSVANAPDLKLKELSAEFYHFSIGKVKKVIDALKASGAKELMLVGKVEKLAIFDLLKLDTTALKILSRAKSGGDFALQRSLVQTLQEHGLEVIDQRRFLSSILTPKGILGSKKPSKSTWQDIQYALNLAREVAKLDIGQTVIVKNKTSLAIEAIEGTNETIRRGGSLGKEKAIVAKAVKPDHDFRFDVPTIGKETIETMLEVKASCLALEAGRAFIVERDEVIRMADRAEIAVVGV
jgi:DUF1009 family protein